MLILSIIVAALAVARLTVLVTEDKITIGLRRWVVNRWGEDSKPSVLIHCEWCVSVWISVPVMPVAVFFPNLWVVAALSIPAASMVSGLLIGSKE